MKKFDVTEYEINTDKISANTEFKFVVISDLHSNVYGVDLQGVLDRIDEISPDAVLMAGDIFNGKKGDDISDAMGFVTAISEKYQIFFGLGNHEYRLAMNQEKYGSAIWEIMEQLGDLGVAVLSDETIVLEKGDDKIALSAVEIDSVFYKRRPIVMGSGVMDMHLGCADKDAFNLLIAHNPRYFKNYANWGADLVLSGHVHGGTVILPGGKPLIGTDFRLFPKYSGGLYEDCDSKMIVSRGLGTHSIKVRINNKPELVVVKIVANNT